MARVLSLFIFCALAACERPPELESALGPEPEGADYLGLLPLSELIALERGNPTAIEETDAELERRAAALRARAAALRARSPG